MGECGDRYRLGYVALGITERIKRREAGKWKICDQSSRLRVDVKNQDLWKLLLHVIRKFQHKGVGVSFWRIPRKWNDRADEFAGKAAPRSAVVVFKTFHSIGPIDVDIKS